MKKSNIFSLTLFLIFSLQVTYSQSELIEKWKQEILDTEQAFAERVVENGMKEAFLFYAAEDAVLKQNETLVIGKEAMKVFYQSQPLPPGIKLEWKPEFVDVSKSGDLGYTYGYYTLSYPGPDGEIVESKGVFHTVWKRQKDGSWKFVWD